MKLQPQKIKTVSRGMKGETYNYQVANSPKVMQMLGDMLYSDKVMAPIRELTANAIDAHIDAGTLHLPIKFNLPSQFDDSPTFTIRDFGTGMSEDKLQKLYRIYGLSDKDQDDFRIGCLGLGSKSVFCYSDSFITTSYYNGKKYVYLNSKLANGVPCLKKIGEEDTDEPNGIEVSYSVKSGDVYELREKLSKVLKRSPVPFESNIPLNIKKNDREVLLEGDGWKVYQSKLYDQCQAIAVMGYIEYPIEQQYFLGDNRYLLGLPIEISFEIGEIEMDISRERLQYNQFTIDAINAKLNEINKALYDLIVGKISEASCMYDARILLKELSLKFERVICSNKGIEWNNELILDNAKILEKIRSDSKYSHMLYIQNTGNKCKYKQLANCYGLEFDYNLAIVIGDTGNQRARVSHFLRNDKSYSRALIVDKSVSDDLLKILGLPKEKAILLSTLPKVQRQQYKRGTYRAYTTQSIDVSTKTVANDKISKSMGQQYYVESLRDNVMFGVGWRTKDSFAKLINRCQSIGIDLPAKVYTIIPSKIEMVKKWGWINIDKYVKKELNKISKSPKINRLGIANINYESYYLNFVSDEKYSMIDYGLFKKYIKLVRKINKYQKEYSDIRILFDAFGIKVKTKYDEINLKKVEDRLCEKYELLGNVSSYYYKPEVQIVIRYINLVETNEKYQKILERLFPK